MAVIRDGKVALQHRSTNPTNVQIEGTDRVYSFVPRSNVCLAWVNEEDVPKLLSIRTKTCECNGGAYGPKFFEASETNVCIHETGDRCK